MSLYHMYVAGVRPAGGDHLPRHAPAVRADAGLPAVPDAPRAGRRGASLDVAAAGAGLRRSCCTSFSTTTYFINRIIYIDDLTSSDKFYAVVAVVIVLEATRRVIGLGAAAHRDRVPGLRDRLHARDARRADGAAVPVHRGHLRLDARRVGELRDAVRAVRRVHGEKRHRPAVHGLRDVDHRPSRRAGPARSPSCRRACSARCRAARSPT